MPLPARPVRSLVESLEGRRLLSAGQPDARFGPNGSKTLTDVYQPLVLLTSDDRVVVVGNAVVGDGLLIERFTANGALDASFDGDGKATTPTLIVPTVALLQKDGKLLVFGEAPTTYESSVVRFNVDGSLDATFGYMGIEPTGLGLYGTARAAAIAGDGKIYVAGNDRDRASDSSTLGLARLTANGSHDRTFAYGGVRDHIEEIGGYQKAGATVTTGQTHIVPLSDGRVVLATQVQAGFFATHVQFFYRFTATGAIDTSLEFTGAYRFDPTSGNDLVNGVAPQADGSFVGVGVRNGLPVAWKFNSSLGFDAAFGTDGQLDAPLGSVTPTDAVTDAAGRSVVLGTAADGLSLVGRRLSTTGAVDPAYAIAQTYGRVTFPQNVAAGPGGTIALAEFSYDDESSSFLAQRFQGDVATTTTPAPPTNVGIDNAYVNEGTSQQLAGYATVVAGQSIVKWEYDLHYDGTTFDADFTERRPTFLADDGTNVPQTLAVRVTDNFGQTVIGTRSFTVRDVAPTATLTATGGAGKATATFTGATDVSAADRAAGFKYGFDFNNDGDFTDAGEVDGATSATATFAYAAGTYVVHGRITDKDGGFADYRANVTVTAPTTGTPTLLTGTPIGTAGSIGGNTIAKAFDGSLATYVDLSGSGPYAIGLDLGAAKTIASVKFAPRATLARRMTGGVFQASNSATFATGVVTLGTIATQPAEGVLTTLNVAASAAAYRYVRYLAPAGSFGNVAELQFFGAAGTTTPPVTPPTGTPTRLTGTGIGTAGSIGGNTFAKALDGDLSTYVDSSTVSGAFVGLDLGTAKVIRQIKFAPRATLGRRMVGGYFQGSNVADFSVAATLFTIATAPVDGILTGVNVTDATAYRYVRYVAPANSFGNVAEVQFFG